MNGGIPLAATEVEDITTMRVAAEPLLDLQHQLFIAQRMSVIPPAIHTRAPAGTAIMWIRHGNQRHQVLRGLQAPRELYIIAAGQKQSLLRMLT